MNGIEASLRLVRPGFTLDAELTVPGHGVTALFGASGSGKTTLLRCLAGLERGAAGRVTVQGEAWQDSARRLFRPPHRRTLGYVFQDAALFPHLDVAGNLDYARRRAPRQAHRLARDEVIAWLGLERLLARRPAGLSGGERQRVAIARALLAAPRLLLMDEPLAALDAAGKADILPYLEALHDRLAIPVIYVSHAIEEVARLADHLVLMDGGRCRAAGPLTEMLARLDLPLAHTAEAGTVLEATVRDTDPAFHLTYLDSPAGIITLPVQHLAPGRRVRVHIAARQVSLAVADPGPSSILNRFSARVLELADDGPAQTLVKLDAGGSPLLARVTRKSAVQLGLQPGLAVHALVKSVALVD